MSNFQLVYDLPHWNLFRSLEEDLQRCFKFIDPYPKHDAVTSDEFAKIILIASSEFENILKEFKILLGGSCRDNITGYYSCVSSHYPRISTIEMCMPRYSRVFTPLRDWSSLQSPDWWQNGYNKIKHDRLSNPDAATLGRALYAVSSVQVLLFYFYQHKFGSLNIPESIAPRLIEPQPIGDAVWETASVSLGWDLP